MISNVLVVTKNTSVDNAINLLINNNISCVIVQDTDHPIGIITERDIVHKVVNKIKNIKKAKVEDIMNAPLVTVSSDTGLEDASKIMQSAGIRRIAVVDEGILKGVVTETDLVKELTKVAKANTKLSFYQNLQSWILIVFFVIITVVLLVKLI